MTNAALKEKYSAFVRESFGESKEFALSLKAAFEDCLNVDTRTAQYLSLFVDDLFRKGNKGTESEIDQSLDQVLILRQIK